MGDSESKWALAFDFGGTKLRAALVDIGKGRIADRISCPTPVAGKAEACLDQMKRYGKDLLQTSSLHGDSIRAVGISFGGPIQTDRRIVIGSMHVAGWEQIHLPEIMEETFGKPAFMENDANAAALGEWFFGVGERTENFLYVQISTGIGAGLILNKRIFRGGGLAGELGHTRIIDNGPICSCGRRGCLESLASGWAIAREGRFLVSAGRSKILTEICCGVETRLTAEMVFKAAEQGDPACLQAIQAAVRHLAAGIANVICLLDPDIIAIGGGLTRTEIRLDEMVSAEIEKILPRMLQNRVKIRIAQNHGDETLLGAALLTEIG